jgi:hypothetical protein
MVDRILVGSRVLRVGGLGLRCGGGGVPFAPLLAFPVWHPRGGEAGGRLVLARGAVVVLRAVSWLFRWTSRRWAGMVYCLVQVCAAGMVLNRV